MIMRIIVNYFKYIQRSSKIQVYDVVVLFIHLLKLHQSLVNG